MKVQANPVLARELRERVRGNRTLFVLTLYLGALLLIFFTIYQAEAGSRSGAFGPISPLEVARVGRTIFELVVLFMLILVLVLVPGLTAGAIAGERERQTLLPLQVTLLSSPRIILGKVQAALALLVLVVVATLPILSVCYLIGGVGVADVLTAVGAVLFSGMVVACIAVACSTITRRSQTATVLAYFLVLVLTLGTFMAWGVVESMSNRGMPDTRPPAAILWANPVVLTGVAVGGRQRDELEGLRGSSPFGGLRQMLEPREQPVLMVGPAIDGTDGVAPGVVRADGPRQQLVPPEPPGDGLAGYAWGSVLTLVALAVLSLVYASYRIRLPAKKDR